MSAPIRLSISGLILKTKHDSLCNVLSSAAVLFPVGQQVRWSTNKHWSPKWRRLRKLKYLEIDLPDFDKIRREAKMDPSEFRAKMKKENHQPPRKFSDKQMLIASTNTIFEPYVPPEGDGLASLVSGKRVTQTFTGLEKKGKSLNNVRKIKKHDEDFDTKEFPNQALEIYQEAHECLNNLKDKEDRLHDLLTERAYPEMTWKLDKKTVRWKFIGSLEPPRIVHVRMTELLSKDNLYAQVTVRFHTQQTLAIYDRFGRILYGSEHLIKDCLEYVVLEKRISEMYSLWRIHGKIIPDWLPPRDDSIRTKKQPQFDPIDDEEGEDGKEKDIEQGVENKDQPQVVTA